MFGVLAVARQLGGLQQHMTIYNKHWLLFQLTLADTAVFGVLAVARQLGVHDLSHHCEEHILSTLSAHNVCTFYSAARKLEKNNPGRVSLMLTVIQILKTV